jgi:hypothetical protein
MHSGQYACYFLPAKGCRLQKKPGRSIGLNIQFTIQSVYTMFPRWRYRILHQRINSIVRHSSKRHCSKANPFTSQPIESMKKGLVIRWLHVCIRVESGLWWSKRKLSLKWKHRIDLPESLPAAFAYKMVVDSLNMKTNIVNSISMNFDFCSGYAPDCIFKAYCPCLKIWNE